MANNQGQCLFHLCKALIIGVRLLFEMRHLIKYGNLRLPTIITVLICARPNYVNTKKKGF